LKFSDAPAPSARIRRTMTRRLFYFRPGEEARMLARCQFGLKEDGECGATLTYPIKGYPWHRNIIKSFRFTVVADLVPVLFAGVSRIRRDHAGECLGGDDLWNDEGQGVGAPLPCRRDSAGPRAL
jgi:hypothetical protein